jgi:hypothetical protein
MRYGPPACRHRGSRGALRTRLTKYPPAAGRVNDVGTAPARRYTARCETRRTWRARRCSRRAGHPGACRAAPDAVRVRTPAARRNRPMQGGPGNPADRAGDELFVGGDEVLVLGVDRDEAGDRPGMGCGAEARDMPQTSGRPARRGGGAGPRTTGRGDDPLSFAPPDRSWAVNPNWPGSQGTESLRRLAACPERRPRPVSRRRRSSGCPAAASRRRSRCARYPAGAGRW